MSPQTSRYPMPAAGDAAEPGGRHRRPETLADIGATVSRPTPGEGRVVRTSTLVSAPRRARHQQAVRPGRHAAPRTPVTRPPVTGSHRAPGTLPIESWLLMGKKRQQVMLASLVAIGLFLVMLPADQRQSGVDAVNAAAQRAVGTSTANKKPKTPAKTGDNGAAAADERAQAEPEPAGSTSAPAKVPATGATKPAPRATDLGPGHSLRTTGTKAIALTFDDGPDPVQTPKILDLLAKNQIKATFCLVGEQVQKHPEVVRQIVAAGHTLCNHTWNHSLTIGKDQPAKIKADLARTDAAIKAAAPGAEVPFFRAPGGNFTDRLVTVAGGFKMTSLYWEVDPRDWDHPTGETADQHIARVVAQVRKHVKPGSIVLSHDFNQPDTIAAYQKLIPWLEQHYTIGMPPGAAPVPPAATPPAVEESAPAL